MDKVYLLNMSITNDSGWFAFENTNMEDSKFNSIVNEIEKTFVSLYGEKGAEAYINKSVDENGKLNVKISQVKVPHIIKSLVQNPYQEIQFSLTGIAPDKEIATEIIKKPLDINKVVRLIPSYHGSKKEQEKSKKR